MVRVQRTLPTITHNQFEHTFDENYSPVTGHLLNGLFKFIPLATNTTNVYTLNYTMPCGIVYLAGGLSFRCFCIETNLHNGLTNNK